jgi:hypothetical protein
MGVFHHEEHGMKVKRGRGMIPSESPQPEGYLEVARE